MSAHDHDGSGPDPGPGGFPDPELLDAEARRELISAYLDGELPAEQARQVSTWLDGDPQALRDVEHLRRTWDLLEAYEDEAVPEDFASRILQVVGIRHVRKAGRLLDFAWFGRPMVFRAAVAAAAVCLVAIGALALFSAGPGDAPVGPPIPSATVAVLEEVPYEFLDDVDLLVDVTDEAFDAYLESEFEEPSDESLGG